MVEDVRDSQPLPLAEVADQIKNNLAQQAVEDVVADLRNNAQIDKYDLNGKKIKEETKEEQIARAVKQAQQAK